MDVFDYAAQPRCPRCQTVMRTVNHSYFCRTYAGWLELAVTGPRTS